MLHDQPLHVALLRSGSQSPFSVQVAESDPLRINPGGQLKVIALPQLANCHSLQLLGQKYFQLWTVTLDFHNILLYKDDVHASIILGTIIPLTIFQSDESSSIILEQQLLH